MSNLEALYDHVDRKGLDHRLIAIGFKITVCFLLFFVSAQLVYAQTIGVQGDGVFGDVMVGDSIGPRTFTISNTAEEGDNLNVTGITVSDTDNYTLDVGDGTGGTCGPTPSLPFDDPDTTEFENECTVEVTFNPTDVGNLDTTLEINSDNADNDPLPVIVDLTGTGFLVGIEVQGDGVFGDVMVGNSIGPRTFTISNTATAGDNLNVTGITVSDTDNYTLDVGDGTGGTCGPTPSLPFDDPDTTEFENECTVEVTFNPTELGTLNATLEVTSDNADNSPFVVDLSGNGVWSIGVDGEGVFGDVLVGESTSEIFRISNDVDADVSVDIDLSGNSDFAFDPDGGTDPCGSASPTITANSSCTIEITFEPGSTGNKNATLEISSDNADNSPVVVDLTGTGVLPEIEIAPTNTAFDYGPVILGTSLLQEFEISNTGDGDLIVSNIGLSGSGNFSLNLNGGSDPCGSASPTLAANGGDCTVTVAFTPTAVATINATLSIASNDLNEGQIDIDLMGQGISAEDIDADGLPDGWEMANFGSLNETSEGDADADGVNNINEFLAGSDPVNARPNAPVLLLPENGATAVLLTPQLATAGFSDPENDKHFITRWQISTDPDFEDDEQIVLDLISGTDLTRIQVPDLVLDLGVEYFWRASFADGAGQISDWPEPFSFITDVVDENDSNLNGIPDGQEVDCTSLFIDGEVPANTVCVNSATGGGQIGLEGSTNVTSIEAYRSINPADIPEELVGVELGLGLISFKAVCNNVGDTIEVIYHLSETIPEGSRLFKWHPVNGWREYANVEFLPDARSVLVRITDGGDGDLDNAANGVVVDPSGVGSQVSAGGAAIAGGGGDDDYDFTCFVKTVITEASIMSDLFALIVLMACGILATYIIRKNQ